MRNNLWVSLLLSTLTAVGLLAQSDRGVITGTVKDTSGAVVAGASVTAIQIGTNDTFKTNTTTSGDFTLPSLPVGTYQLSIETLGFKTYVLNNILVTPGSSARTDATLELGTTQQTVEVTAAAQLLQSETAQVSSQVTTRLIEDLPLVVGGTGGMMRSPFDLAVTTPDVEMSGTSARVGGGNYGQYAITLDGISAGTGSNQGSGAYLVDWVMINTPSVDAITQFAVDSNGFKAEYGHATGGLISFVSKSGTNAYHGDAYEFLRNNDLDARGFFLAKRAIYKQHDFGATIGGPVRIPKLYNGKDRTFFFFSYEGFRNRVGSDATVYSVPPPEFYTGDLRNWVDQNNKLIPVYDPATNRQVNGTWVRDPFPNNQIPQTRFDSFSKTVMAYGAAAVPNVANLVPGTSGYVRNNYVSSGSALDPYNKTSFRIDQNIKKAHRLGFYFGRTTKHDVAGTDGPTGLPGVLSSFQEGIRHSDVYRLDWDYVISPRLLNRFYAGGNNWREDHWNPAQGQDGQGGGWKAKGVCMINVADCDTDLTQVSFDGEFTAWSGNAHNGSDNIVVNFKDDMSYVRGSHTLKWGYAYDNTHYNGKGEQAIAGITTFDQLQTSVPLNTTQATGGGSAFAAFLLGDAYGWNLHTGSLFVSRQFRDHAWFIQDDWHVSSRLTLNYGVRYEFQLPPLDGQDHMTDFSPTTPNPAAGGILGATIFDGFGPGHTNSRTMTPGWWGGVGPRIGLAYTLTNKTVIRSSFARSFGAIRGGPRHADGYAVQISATTTNQGLTPFFIYSQGMPAWPHPPDIDPSVANGTTPAWFQGTEASRAPQTADWSFSIQRQLSASTMLDLNYRGTAGSHLPSQGLDYNAVNADSVPAILSPFTAAGRTLLNSNINSAAAVAAGIRTPYPSFTGSVAQALRPFPQYNGISAEARGAHSTYHAMTVKLEKRYSSGVTLQGSYVFSKTLTDLGGGLINQFDRALEKSIASYDQTHSVKFALVYELPFGPGKKFLRQGVASKILGGWHVGDIQTYASGFPLPLSTTISFPTGMGGNRPTITTYDGWQASVQGAFDPHTNNFFQPVSFFGTQPTNSKGNMTEYNPKCRDFPNYNENISLAKSFPIKESLHLELRGEAFNLLNRTRFGAISSATSLQNPSFGLWQAQQNVPRQMQVALKLSW